MPDRKIEIGCGGEGIGFWGLLTILFIAFKLTNIIDWSWWWVLCPIWIDAFITFAIVFILVFTDNFKR